MDVTRAVPKAITRFVIKAFTMVVPRAVIKVYLGPSQGWYQECPKVHTKGHYKGRTAVQIDKLD